MLDIVSLIRLRAPTRVVRVFCVFPKGYCIMPPYAPSRIFKEISHISYKSVTFLSVFWKLFKKIIFFSCLKLFQRKIGFHFFELNFIYKLFKKIIFFFC